MGLTVSRVNEVLHYDPDTGHFTWKVKTHSNVIVGNRAGSAGGGGRRYIGIDGTKSHEHRLAVLLMTGGWPTGDVDHVNGDPSDNRWRNLRVASRTENLGNQKRRKDNKSGFKGVHWSTQNGKWRVAIRHEGKKRHLGLVDDPAEGHRLYMRAADELFGQFAFHGER